MLGYRLVEQRAFGVAWVVEFGFCSDWHEYCTNAQYSAAIVWVRKAQGPNRRQFGPWQGSLAADLLARRRHIRAAAMRHFRFSFHIPATFLPASCYRKRGTGEKFSGK